MTSFTNDEKADIYEFLCISPVMEQQNSFLANAILRFESHPMSSVFVPRVKTILTEIRVAKASYEAQIPKMAVSNASGNALEAPTVATHYLDLMRAKINVMANMLVIRPMGIYLDTAISTALPQEYTALSSLGWAGSGGGGGF
jgi:hypothetical protein